MSYKFIRHKHTTEFLKDIYIHLQESDSNPLSGPVRNGYFQFIVVSQQFNCTTSTWPFVREFRVPPILWRLDVLGQNRTAWLPLAGRVGCLHRTSRRWVAHTSATQVRLDTTNQNNAGPGGRWRVWPDVTSPESVMFRGKVNVLCLLSGIVILLCRSTVQLCW